MRPSVVVVHHGVFLDGDTAWRLWRALGALTGRVPDQVLEVKEALRLAASAHFAEIQGVTSGPGHSARTSTDRAAQSNHEREPRTASEIAGSFGITARHVRRLATQHGIDPVSANPYRWDAEGQAHLRALLRNP